MRFTGLLGFQVSITLYLMTFCHAETLNIVEKLDAIYEQSENVLSTLKEALLQVQTNDSSNTSIKEVFPTSCLNSEVNENGLYTLEVPGLSPFQVYCENNIAGPGWIVIQKRFSGNLSFFRNWKEYKDGFGDLMGEYFLGLEKIRALTALEPHELYVHLEDFDETIKYAKFDEFAIGNEEDDYAMNALGKYSGTAGDSLRSHRKMKFSTYDRDNDREFNRNCAFYYLGGWWYNACLDSNLNGQYMPGGKYEEKLFARGMCWRSWRGHNYGYRITQMLIRPKCRNIPVIHQ
ncbi:fibrinogen C domain-containing protein 1 [Drosophila rhopaloa]|uniref:Fibrinogen C-terminal domain-containing protein n=1 Tax=Drosophila rhopaloa TaxID=1041015 RepID=A0ABM5H836_DRORH|nr:fibrinogen C domain-containing protein 1 [Drosophila rhopaloa]